jgi:hypothetical protein
LASDFPPTHQRVAEFVHNLCTGNDYFLGFRSSKDYKPSVPLHSKDVGLIAGEERDATDPVACAGLSRSRRTG